MRNLGALDTLWGQRDIGVPSLDLAYRMPEQVSPGIRRRPRLAVASLVSFLETSLDAADVGHTRVGREGLHRLNRLEYANAVEDLLDLEIEGTNTMRVFAISDVHTDFPENLRLLAELSTHSYRDDALILAGDVSHDAAVLRATLSIFLERFRHVFFVPGNHELWVRNGEYEHSLQKFADILRMCESLGVRTAPGCVGDGADRVCIVPLFAWYTRPEEGTDSLFRERQMDEGAVSLWTDDYLIKWPAGFRAAQFFHDMNEKRVSARYEASRVSFSHFVPRADLMFPSGEDTPPLQPEPRARNFNFSRVAGSTLIEKQIRALDSRVHVYGHQHRNRSRRCEGIWYVSNCLGYREERERRSLLNPPTLVRAIWPLEADS